MTLDQALTKAAAFVDAFYDAKRDELRDDLHGAFEHATDAELAAILDLHEHYRAEAHTRARDIITGAFYTGTGGIH